MDLVVVPEPDPEQRKAVQLALAKLFPGDEAVRPCWSAWWEAGVAENLEDGPPGEGFR